MKTKIPFLLSLIFILPFIFFLSGCVALELAELGAADLGVAEMGTADLAMVGRSGLGFTEAGVAVDDAVVFNKSFGEVALMSSPLATNPGLGVMENGKMTEIGEILKDEGMIRLRNGKKIPIHHDMYIVNNEVAYVRDSPYSSNSNVLSKINHGNWLFKLSEENGWYKVRFAEYQEGFIDPAFLTPVFLMSDKGKKKENNNVEKPLSSFIADKSFLNKKDSKEVALIVTDGQAPNAELTNLLKNILVSKGYNITTNLFSSQLIYDGSFDRLFDGEIQQFKNMGLKKYVDYLFLVTIPVSYKPNQFKDMVSAKAPVNIHVLDASTGFLIDSYFFKMAGVGFNQAQATETLNKHVREKTASCTFNF